MPVERAAARPGTPAQLRAQGRVVDEAADRRAEGRGVEGRDGEPGVGSDPGESVEVERDHRPAVGHRLQRGQAERLVARGHDHQRAAAQQFLLGRTLHPAQQPDAVPEARDELAQPRLLGRGAGPRDVEVQVRVRAHRVEEQVEALLPDVDAPEEEHRAVGDVVPGRGQLHPVRDHRDPRPRARRRHEARVDVVQDDEVTVEREPAPLDRLERQPVAELHVGAAEHLDEPDDGAARHERQQARRHRGREALDPHVRAHHEREQRHQQREQDLPAPRPGPPDGQVDVAHAVAVPRHRAAVGAAVDRDVVLVGEPPGDPRDHRRAAPAVVGVAEVVVDRDDDAAPPDDRHDERRSRETASNARRAACSPRESGSRSKRSAA